MYLENLFKKTFMDPASDSSLTEAEWAGQYICISSYWYNIS